MEFKNIDEIARFLHNHLPYHEPLIIKRHLSKDQWEWFIHSVEAWADIRLGWLQGFRIEVSKDKKAIRKVKV